MFLYSSWLKLSLVTRALIAKEFNIVKRGPTHVDSNIVVSDGYNIKEVEQALSLENLQRFLQTAETDATTLFQMLLDRVEGRTMRPDVITSTNVLEVVASAPKEVVKKEIKKRGRTAKTK